MKFNVDKCHIIEFRESGRRPHWEYKLGANCLQNSRKEKDLGVTINSKFSPENHINDKVRNMYIMLGNIKATFKYIDEDMVRKSIISFIRPVLEYAVVI